MLKMDRIKKEIQEINNLIAEHKAKHDRDEKRLAELISERSRLAVGETLDGEDNKIRISEIDVEVDKLSAAVLLYPGVDSELKRRKLNLQKESETQNRINEIQLQKSLADQAFADMKKISQLLSKALTINDRIEKNHKELIGSFERSEIQRGLRSHFYSFWALKRLEFVFSQTVKTGKIPTIGIDAHEVAGGRL